MNPFIKSLFLTVLNYESEDRDLEFISDFTFVWSVFENKLNWDNQSVTLRRIKKLIDSVPFQNLNIKSSSYNSIPRFIGLKKTDSDLLVTLHNVNFEISLFPTGKISDFDWLKNQINLEDCLIEKGNNNILFFMFIIAYRIRNNLFHGTKETIKLYEQNNLFKIINNFLLEFLQKTKSINFNLIS